MSRGILRVYLGAAPGVGKTYAMLDEGWRRKERGTDVVVGLIETHNRPKTIAQVRDLEIVPRRRVEYRGTVLEEMDVDAVLARRPHVALVDELAHTNVPGSRNEKRWHDIEELLNAGINVISTVNVQHLGSLNDVVEKITGIVQRETVPDAFVRSADQIELVDMSPEALRRRMAHGNIYAPERIDAALANYFRPGNLGALRELALLWVADRVEDTLQQYLVDHGVAEAWETRERVVVAITGAPSGDALIRRAARMATRTKGDLRGVRIVASDGLAPSTGEDHLAAQRKMLKELGGTYHEIVGDDIATALVDFARAERATQLVLGATQRSRRQELTRGSVIGRVLRIAGSLDVHVIATALSESRGTTRRRRSPLPSRRLVMAWVLLAVGAPTVTAALLPFRDDIELSTVLLTFLALAVAVAAFGGLCAGAAAGLVGFTLSDLLFVRPYGSLTVGDGEDVVALFFFIAVVLTVAVFVDRVGRLHWQAQRSRAQVAALARSTADLVADNDPLPRLVEDVRSALDLASVTVLVNNGVAWSALAAAGQPIANSPADGTSIDLATDESEFTHVLVVRGRALDADEHETLRTIADQITVAIDARTLAAHVVRADTLEDVDALRTALLQAVSHDLRTPLATMKAYVSGLRQSDVTWSADELAEAHAAIEIECDRLNRLVGNLLDAGRLQVGSLAVALRPTAIEEPIAAAAAPLQSTRVTFDVPEDLPLVWTDPTLLERALANLLANADNHSPPGSRVMVEAQLVGDRLHVRVVDRGPGIPEDQRDAVFQPFQRLHDSASQGTGLGLAITQGFVDAIDGTLDLDDTPGGGLTATVTLPLAESLAQSTKDVREGVVS